MNVLIVDKRIERMIFIIRGHKVMLDHDLAGLYEVPTKALNQAVRRNPGRFPVDFVFPLTPDEKDELVTNCDRFASLKHAHNPPYAFTQEGVAMLSSVLRSERAVRVNVQIMRVFVRLRELLATHKDLAKKLENLERKYDARFKVVFDAIRKLMEKPAPSPHPKLAPVPVVKGFSHKKT